MNWREFCEKHAQSLKKHVVHFDIRKDSFGWIQFKGTDLCMDIHCRKCGFLSHVDDMFAYNVKCPKCGTVYEVNGNVELIEQPILKDADEEEFMIKKEKIPEWDERRQELDSDRKV